MLRTKIATNNSEKIFLPVESFETSSSGPGCLKAARNSTNKSIMIYPKYSSTAKDRNVKTHLAFSLTRPLAVWPPPSIPVGNRLSMVVN
jgi:hypothetical protein